MWLQDINKVMVTHQSQRKISTFLQILCCPYSLQVGGLHSTEMLLIYIYLLFFKNLKNFNHYIVSNCWFIQITARLLRVMDSDVHVVIW